MPNKRRYNKGKETSRKNNSTTGLHILGEQYNRVDGEKYGIHLI